MSATDSEGCSAACARGGCGTSKARPVSLEKMLRLALAVCSPGDLAARLASGVEPMGETDAMCVATDAMRPSVACVGEVSVCAAVARLEG